MQDNSCKSIKNLMIEYYRKLRILYKRKNIKNHLENSFSLIFILLSFSIFAIVIFTYLNEYGTYLFGLIDTENEKDIIAKIAIERHAQFGDFAGGILNPIFALLGLIALLWTLRVQIDALKTSKEELRLTRKELAKSSKAQLEQSNSIKIQNFENTFFNMLNLHKEIIANLSLIKKKKDWKSKHENWRNVPSKFREQFGNIAESEKVYLYTVQDKTLDIEEDNNYHDKKALSKLFEILNIYLNDNVTDSDEVLKCYNSFYEEHNEIIGHYFRNIYQILKFINKTKNNNLNTLDEKFYTNILRAQLSNAELGLLFLNALSDYGKDKLLPLLIEYEFLEPLPKSIFKNKNIKFILEIDFNKNIFGKSKEWTV